MSDWKSNVFRSTLEGKNALALLISQQYAQRGVEESKLPIGVPCHGTIIGSKIVQNDSTKEFLCMYVVNTFVNNIPTECTVMAFDGLAQANGTPVTVTGYVHTNGRKYSKFITN